MGESLSDVQISFPQLPRVGSVAQAAILRQWLRSCDESHGDCCLPRNWENLRLPTRLIKVGTHSTSVQLVESIDFYRNGDQDLRFAALSYPWGASGIHRHYSTTVANYEEHKDAILLENLPSLLQDAVRVARAMEVPYLWIDALCIIQGPEGDFKYEAERMEDVFSAAYCVIAASRSTGVSDGFLGERKQRRVVTHPHSRLFLAEDIDDFQHDVIEGPLNQRGWVLQERALARRTIYFTEKQIYWECGKGIRCETFTKMNK